MIVRIWRGSAAVGANADAYEKHVTATVFPAVCRLDGNCGARLLKRRVGERIEFLAVTYWKTMEAVTAFAGENVELAVVEPAAQAVLAEFDPFVNHYEVAYAAGVDGTNRQETRSAADAGTGTGVTT